jgi:hypothetical protein
MTEPQGFGHWMAGFIDGEGSFTIPLTGKGHMPSPRFVLGIRADDIDILRSCCVFVNAGAITISNAPTRRNPVATWLIQNKADCLRLVNNLDTYPLRAKKLRDYHCWRAAVMLHQTVKPGCGPGRTSLNTAVRAEMMALKKEMEEGRKYVSYS